MGIYPANRRAIRENSLLPAIRPEVPVERMMTIGGFLTIQANHPLRLVQTKFQASRLPARPVEEIGGFLTNRANHRSRLIQAKFQTPRLPAHRIEEN